MVCAPPELESRSVRRIRVLVADDDERSLDALVSLLRYHPVGETPDADVDRAALEDLLDRVRPGWRRDRADVHFRARMVAVHDQPQAERGGLRGRADVDAVGHPRVSIAGDWVGGDGLLADAAFASARDAAARAVAQVAIR